jgi:hypothetical protein
MTRPEFRQRLAALSLSMTAFAKLAGIRVATASEWGRDNGCPPFPAWVGLLLTAWERCPAALGEARSSGADPQ